MAEQKINSYRDLIVWQKSMRLTTQIYRITENFPRSEQFGLALQLRRAAVSIPSNIAEGYTRRHRKEYRQFLLISYGSVSELDTQLTIARNLKFVSEGDFGETHSLLTEVGKILNRITRSLAV